jgi:hypothetical protein
MPPSNPNNDCNAGASRQDIEQMLEELKTPDYKDLFEWINGLSPGVARGFSDGITRSMDFINKSDPGNLALQDFKMPFDQQRRMFEHVWNQDGGCSLEFMQAWFAYIEIEKKYLDHRANQGVLPTSSEAVGLIGRPETLRSSLEAIEVLGEPPLEDLCNWVNAREPMTSQTMRDYRQDAREWLESGHKNAPSSRLSKDDFSCLWGLWAEAFANVWDRFDLDQAVYEHIRLDELEAYKEAWFKYFDLEQRALKLREFSFVTPDQLQDNEVEDDTNAVKGQVRDLLGEYGESQARSNMLLSSPDVRALNSMIPDIARLSVGRYERSLDLYESAQRGEETMQRQDIIGLPHVAVSLKQLWDDSGQEGCLGVLIQSTKLMIEALKKRANDEEVS